MTGTRRVLVVTAVPPERDAVVLSAGAAPDPLPLLDHLVLHRVRPPGRGGNGPGGLLVDTLAAGVGPAAAAAGTSAVLALAPGAYEVVISAGIAGGFAPGVPVGGTVVASAIVAADLGGQTAEGFTDVAQMGFGVAAHRPPPGLARAMAEAAGAVLAPVLTVSTVTGTTPRAEELAARHAGAAAEAMEGFGVATAAALFGVPALEVRTVSNAVGPRDRAAWRIPEALRALTDAFAAIWPVLDVRQVRDVPDVPDVRDDDSGRNRGGRVP
ncbi:futalosine hydrolase [Streptomyces klenkii]|uniref:Futalosine hydrolase n=1 Tax=Streptomyces klenkii TaxID=1420899 RepID=A0A3A9ZWW8_9ACTN|nr:futalosine hydrolase [Streptomyces klenkii]